MCIDIASSGRKLYGFLYRNDSNEFIYSCSQCNVEFDVGNELEKHTVDHDVKEETETVQSVDLAIDLQPIEVYPPQLSPTNSIKNESIPLDSSTKEEMAIYLPFDAPKVEVNIEEQDTECDVEEALGNDFTAFDVQNDPSSSSSSDDDFFAPKTKKKSTKKSTKAQKETKKNT